MSDKDIAELLSAWLRCKEAYSLTVHNSLARYDADERLRITVQNMLIAHGQKLG